MIELISQINSLETTMEFCNFNNLFSIVVVVNGELFELKAQYGLVEIQCLYIHSVLIMAKIHSIVTHVKL